LTHRLVHRALVATAVTVALVVAAAPAAASSEPLIVPISSAEHANPDVMVAPASSSEHSTPGSSTALIVPLTSTEHRPVSTTAVIAAGGRATQFGDSWDVLAAAGLLLAVLGAAVMAIRLQVSGRDVAV
jgi:hypothetical protein